MRWLREWLLNNWWLKLLALGLSFALWATYTAEPIVEVGYLVPLEFRNIPANLEISGDVPTQVHVRLRGRAALLRRLTPADVEVAVNLAGRPAGEARLRLTPDEVKAPLGAGVVSVTPAQLRVPLVPRRAESQSP
jgi:YbbR domain-containing protein